MENQTIEIFLLIQKLLNEGKDKKQIYLAVAKQYSDDEIIKAIDQMELSVRMIA